MNVTFGRLSVVVYPAYFSGDTAGYVESRGEPFGISVNALKG